MKVSVVIPAYNEERYIKKCLESLVAQETEFEYEVVVVDNSSTDKTTKIVSQFRDKLDLKIVKEKRQGRGTARAKGFDEAKGDIILSTDADTIVYEDWISTLVEPIRGDIIASTTSCKIVDCPYLTRIIFNFLDVKLELLYRLLFGYHWLAGFSFAILKSAYKKSGGFDPNLQASEDLQLSSRVAKLGKIKFIDKPVIFSGRRFKKGLIKGLYQYAKAFIQLIFKRQVYLSNVR